MKNHEEVFEAYLDGRADPDSLSELDRAIREDEELCREFADFIHQEGVLRAEAGELFPDQEEAPEVSRFRSGTLLAAAAALMISGLALGWVVGSGDSEMAADPPEEISPVATLADTRSCKWGAGSLPTAEGTRLRPGRLELLEGLATVKFDSGATVTLEAPASLELESEMRCRLVDGAAVAWVPDGAEGFQIQTDDALVTDYGTRFGVTAGGDGKSEVLVLEGEVGVTHRKSDGEKRLKTGELVRFDAEQLIESAADSSDESVRFSNASPEAEGWMAVTTDDGRGQDAYIRQEHDKSFGDSPLLMVKNSQNFAGNRRKAYLTFDLAEVGNQEIAEAELVLSIESSGLGYASVVPDATFAVHALVDELEAVEWDETSLRWPTAPANVADHGFQLDPARTQLLGEFVVEQGVSSGLRRISGDALSDFLESDGDGLVTLIIVRLTDETDRHGLVHAFASSEHPAAMAPTLRLRFR